LKRKKVRKLLINMEERELVLNSQVIEKYPKLKMVLRKYKTVSKDDLLNEEDFDEETKNIIQFVFKGIKDEAQKEWRGTGEPDIIDPPNINDRIKCSLCGRRNIYIFYIINRYNNNKLNVGSDCIDKFPKIDNKLPEGMTLRQAKSSAAKGYHKLKRLEIFNKRFPDAQNMIEDWRIEYSSLPITLPAYLHNEIEDVHSRANTTFKNYINGKGSEADFIIFEELITKRRDLMLQCMSFIEENKNNKFICTKEIYDWILEKDNHKERLIKEIRDSTCILNEKSIPYIYEEKFFDSIVGDFRRMIEETRLTIDYVGSKDVNFIFKDTKQRLVCELYISKMKFMALYGVKLLEDKPKIEEKNLLSNVEFVINEKNFNIIKEQVEIILNRSKYRIKINFDDIKYGLTFEDVEAKLFTGQLSPKVFFNQQKEIILLKEGNAQKNLCNIIQMIRTWKPLSDKDKYDIGDITKKPEEIEKGLNLNFDD